MRCFIYPCSKKFPKISNCFTQNKYALLYLCYSFFFLSHCYAVMIKYIPYIYLYYALILQKKMPAYRKMYRLFVHNTVKHLRYCSCRYLLPLCIWRKRIALETVRMFTEAIASLVRLQLSFPAKAVRFRGGSRSC